MLNTSVLILNSHGAGVDTLLPHTVSLTDRVKSLIAANDLGEAKSLLHSGNDVVSLILFIYSVLLE